MRNLLIISILIGHVWWSTLFAQVTTPNGTSIDYTVKSEGDIALLEYHAAQWLSDRGWTSYVTKIGDATTTYNCHSYAWYKSEGGSNNYWVYAFLNSDMAVFDQGDYSSSPPSPNNINKYWTDYSYIEVNTEDEATKVWYSSCWQWTGDVWINNCDHSAVRLASGLYESKWGAWPLYRHPADKCPYVINNRRYFKRGPYISGPSTACSSGAEFTINNPLTGFTVTWSSDPIPEDEDYSIAPNGNECTITNDDHVGEIILTATIFNDYDTINVSKEILLTYTPNYYTFYATLTTDGNTDWLQDCEGLLTYTFPGMYSGEIEVSDPPYVPFINNITWTKISQENCSFADVGVQSNGKSVFLNFKPFGCTALIRMTATNDCGSFYNDYTFTAGIGCEKKSQSAMIPSQILIYPNPTSGLFTIKYKSGDSDTGIKEIILKSSLGKELMRRKYNGQELIILDISKQMAGIYFLEVFDGKSRTTHQISVQK
jgi:hypothetical protein